MADRVLVIGLDGATWTALDPLMGEGRMPALAALTERGFKAALESTVPPVTAPAWSSFITGCNPGQHGIYQFYEIDPWSERALGRGAETFLAEPGIVVNGKALGGPKLWEIASDAGLRCATVNLPMTYPPSPINGLMVTDMLTPPGSRRFTTPPELADELVDYEIDLTPAEKDFTLGDDAFLARAESVLDKRGRAVVRLFERESWDLFVAIFTETDRLQHRYWNVLRPDARTADTAALRERVVALYEKLDGYIAALVERAGDDVRIVVVSDHGFGAAASRRVSLERLAVELGFSSRRIVAETARKARDHKAPRLQVPCWLVPDGRLRNAERMARDRALRDVKGKLVKLHDYIGGVWIHAAARGGPVPDADVPALREQIIDTLLGLRDPKTGARFVERAVPREALFSGERVSAAPDVIFFVDDPLRTRSVAATERNRLHVHAAADRHPPVRRHRVACGTRPRRGRAVCAAEDRRRGTDGAPSAWSRRPRRDGRPRARRVLLGRAPTVTPRRGVARFVRVDKRRWRVGFRIRTGRNHGAAARHRVCRVASRWIDPLPDSTRMIALAIDRLDQRRHTFGLLLEHLVAALRDEAGDLDIALIRDRRRCDIASRVEGVRELFIPRALVPNATYDRFGPRWMHSAGARVVHFPFLYAPVRNAGLKTVVTIHGASRAALGDDLVTRFSTAELARVRARLQHVDRVITVSESARDEVVEHYGVSSDRITVIHNGVGEGFHPGAANAAVLARYGIRQPFILTISTLKPKKNVAASVRTFAELRRRHPDLPHQLVLVGYKAAGYTEVDDAIRELGLEAHVVQTGWTERRDPGRSMPQPTSCCSQRSTRDSVCRSSRQWHQVARSRRPAFSRCPRLAATQSSPLIPWTRRQWLTPLNARCSIESSARVLYRAAVSARGGSRGRTRRERLRPSTANCSASHDQFVADHRDLWIIVRWPCVFCSRASTFRPKSRAEARSRSGPSRMRSLPQTST